MKTDPNQNIPIPPRQYDPVSHPSHYISHPSGVECITITRHMSFNLGNVIKYIWRAGQKGEEVEDLKKALWYLQDEIKRVVEARGEVEKEYLKDKV